MKCTTSLGYPADWKTRSLQIRRDAGYKCEECLAGPRPHNPLTVHHVDGDPSNNKADNLVVLCASCHLRVQQTGRALAKFMRPYQADLFKETP